MESFAKEIRTPDRAKLGDLLKSARIKARKSQETMSLEMEIARKTVQNWEKGIGRPTIDQAIEWFRILGTSPLPYLFQYIYPDLEYLNSKDEDETLKAALITLIETLPPEGIRELLYLFYGDHGSSPRAVLNLFTAYLQTPIKDRIVQASIIVQNYELTTKLGHQTDKNHIQPNLEIIKKAISEGQNAHINNAKSYILPVKVND